MTDSFFTPPDHTGIDQLTIASGLKFVTQGHYDLQPAGLADGVTLGLHLKHPDRDHGGELKLTAVNWQVPAQPQFLCDYHDAESDTLYPASRCKFVISGYWMVWRKQNKNSVNTWRVYYNGYTETDQGRNETVDGKLISFVAPIKHYVIQGPDVEGGSRNDFLNHEFYVKVFEMARSDSRRTEFESNTVTRAIWRYRWQRSYQLG